jgi:DNA-binding CsgD family transcriptional regulator
MNKFVVCHRRMKAPKRNLSIAEIIQLGESGGLLTQSQIAALMQLSNSTVSRMVNSNQILYVCSFALDDERRGYLY